METHTTFLDVLGRAREVSEYQADPELTRRPLSLMAAGGVLAALSAVLCGLLAKQIWLDHSVDAEAGLFGVSLLFVFYVAGVYIFALAYQLYDVESALRLTLLMAVLGVVALGFMIFVFAALFWLKTGAGIVHSERQQNTLLRAVSHLGGEEEEAEQQRSSYDFLIKCKHCSRDYIPVPPDAMCPWCDTPFFPKAAAGA